jgi:hypothetical protein
MSMGGLLAQAFLGGSAEVGKGIGDRIRADAQAKRKESLLEKGTEEANKQAKFGAGLKAEAAETQREFVAGESQKDRSFRLNESSADRNFRSGESQKDRAHDIALAEMNKNDAMDLAKYKYGLDLNLAQKKAAKSGELTGWQTASLERINGDIDHLQGMESELMAPEANEFGVMPESAGAGEKLKTIRQRIKAKEISLNRVLGNSKGFNAVDPILTEASNATDPADQAEFMAAFRDSPQYDERIENEIMTVWDAQSEPSQQGSGSPPAPAPKPEPAPAPELAPEPAQARSGTGTGVTMPQAAGQNQRPGQGQSSGQSSGQNQRPETAQRPQPGGTNLAENTPNRGLLASQKQRSSAMVEEEQKKPAMDRRMGPYIQDGLVSGVKAVGDWYQGAQSEERNERRGVLMQLSEGEDPFEGNRQALLQFLKFSRNEIKDLQPKQIEALRAQLGSDLVDRYLTAE